MGDAKKLKLNTGLGDVDNRTERIVWVDLEMTGLDVQKDKIIEIACLVTTGNLDIVAEGPNLIIHQPQEVMDEMNDWCKEHHGQSGLTRAVLESKTSMEEAEKQVLSFVQQHTEPGWAPLGGNSIHVDRVFLMAQMPSIVNHLHHRIIDVSTVKELCRRWYPDTKQNAPKKNLSHRAMDDIRESIQELQYYRQAIFKSPSTSAADRSDS
ncbi:hypothetical protein BaRGS_00016213 [Batillaria attramentaria]|uniref:Exonuclease domain-containing protein n=1 Tax=Batillaria attramentaria TaxID=370345 RepID=A0ABD0KZG0_9CAEN